jgi:hypothetical protein
MWVPAFRIIPYKPKSPVAAGVARKRSLTANIRKCLASAYICSPVIGNGDKQLKNFSGSYKQSIKQIKYNDLSITSKRLVHFYHHTSYRA